MVLSVACWDVESSSAFTLNVEVELSLCLKRIYRENESKMTSATTRIADILFKNKARGIGATVHFITSLKVV